MRNGGGPACLRLRVALTGDELARVHRVDAAVAFGRLHQDRRVGRPVLHLVVRGVGVEDPELVRVLGRSLLGDP